MKTISKLFVAAFLMSLTCFSSTAPAATMNDYCVTPPFIQESILPNLLLIIDNSASMFDLAYSDKGKNYAGSSKYCSTTTTTSCTTDANCPSGEKCTSFSRQPYYCYDQTYTTKVCSNDKKTSCTAANVGTVCGAGKTCDDNVYVGYFDSSKLYKYVSNEFVEDTAAFSCIAAGGEEAKSIAGQLCVIYTTATPPVLVTSKFRATGNYLNWLTASKIDVQKEILTGGKYVTKVCSNDSNMACVSDANCGTGNTCNAVSDPFLMAESRGCVGQSFVKEAITANFVNYISPETNNTNAALGITFGIRGPYDKVNPSAPSPGGQTYLDIYKGNYDQGKCQEAMNSIVSGGNADIKQDVADCLASTVGSTAVTKTKVVFQQSMQACWQKREGHAIGGDDINTVKNQCTDIYDEYATCSNDPKKVCTTATVATDCGAGYTCKYGPPAIVPGNSALLCGNEYEGQYYYEQGAGTAGTCKKDGAACTIDSDCTPATYAMCKNTSVVCTSNADCPGSGNSCVDSPASKLFTNTCLTSATTAGWLMRPGTTDDMMIATHNQFCTDMTATQVIDPTDAPSDTSMYDNVPAILSGVGLDAQLNQPIGSLAVKIKKTTAPTGYINEFSKQVRIGAMTFNFAGSAAEVTAGTLTAPRLCSNDSSKVCTINIDCVSPGTCDATTSGTTNRDGAKIIHYIGTGHCSTATATVCYNDSNCPSGEHCISDGVGDYTTGLIQAVNGIRGQSWTPFAEAFYNAIGYFAKDTTTVGKSRSALRLNSDDYIDTRNPSQYRCQSNNILLISDGMSTADRNTTVDNLAKLYTAAGGSTSWTTGATGCPSYAGSVNLDNMAWIGRNLNINTFSTSTASAAVAVENKELNEYVTSYVVFNGDSNGQAGECDSRTLLSQTATNGGTALYQAVDPTALDEALRDAFKAIVGGAASGTAASILSNSEGSGATLLQALFYPSKEFDKTNESDTYATSTSWIGELQGYWYHLDPFLRNTSIREDTNRDYKLNLKDDKIIQIYFDPVDKKTLVNKYSDLNGDGVADSSTPDVDAAGLSPDVVNSLWKAGRKLWARNLATDPRTIYTGYSPTAGSTPRKFSKLAGDGYLNTWPGFQKVAQTSACSVTKTTSCGADTDCPSGETCVYDDLKTAKLIDYVHGIDQADHTDGTKYRPRKVTINVCSNNKQISCVLDSVSDCPSGGTCTGYNQEWKLGDIISSTPKLVSNLRINNYNLPSPTGYGDTSYAKFTETTAYKNRGMAFVGANDGMLHAFKLGVLKELKDKFNKAQMNDDSGNLADDADNLGREEWAFIPSDAIPFLKYLHDPAYSHLYFVDRSPTVFDASIGVPTGCATDYSTCTKAADGSTWRTVLIGGMGIGGASKDFGTASGVALPQNTGYGYSQYFALDVTTPAAPKYLWALHGGSLGFATTGPAIIRISHKDASGKADHTKNGKWFAVFASGPTGPIDTITHQFKGESDQNLRLFIVDIKSGTVVRTIDTGIANAFAGTLTSSWIDADRAKKDSNGYYSDDAVYIGYTQKDTTTNTWTKGGVLRLLTRESDDPDSTDVTKKWNFSVLIDGIGPVTTSVTKLQDRANKNLWIYFGTGRFFYKSDDNAANSLQKLIGVREPCYSTANRTMALPVAGGTDNDIDQNCSDAAGALVDQTWTETQTPTSSLASTAAGWFINLIQADSNYLAKRVITDPVASPAGAVFFTSFRPSADLCKFGGDSSIWAVNYANGSCPPCTSIQGKGLMQVSTGAFAEIDLQNVFCCTPCNGNCDPTDPPPPKLPPPPPPPPPEEPVPPWRPPTEGPPITGVPPAAQGLSLFTNPPPTKKLMHVREK